MLAALPVGVARAEAQAHVAYRPSLCGAGETGIWQGTRFCNGLVADLMLGRKRNADLGYGLHAELSSAGFWDARLAGGPTLLVPVSLDYPLVLAAAFGTHEFRAPTLGGSLFFGARSYNFHGAYNLAAGFFAAGYRDLGASGASVVMIGAELDLLYLAAPFLFAASSLH